MEEKEKEKIGMVEMILGGLITLSIDIVLIIIKLIGIGLILYLPIRGLGFFLMTWFFKNKGDEQAMSLEKILISKALTGWIPFLPMLFIIFCIESYIHNHPKSAISKAKEVTAKAEKATGRVGEIAKKAA